MIIEPKISSTWPKCISLVGDCPSPDFVDPVTGDGWRFCTRIVGLGHLAPDSIQGWLPMEASPDLLGESDEL